MYGCTEHIQTFSCYFLDSTAFTLHCALEMAFSIQEDENALDVNTILFYTRTPSIYSVFAAISGADPKNGGRLYTKHILPIFLTQFSYLCMYARNLNGR